MLAHNHIARRHEPVVLRQRSAPGADSKGSHGLLQCVKLGLTVLSQAIAPRSSPGPRPGLNSSQSLGCHPEDPAYLHVHQRTRLLRVSTVGFMPDCQIPNFRLTEPCVIAVEGMGRSGEPPWTGR